MGSIAGAESGARWAAIKAEVQAWARSHPGWREHRRPIRFGAWEYTDPQGVEERHQAQFLYLTVLESLEPRVLEELLEEPFAALEATWRATGRDDPPAECEPTLGGGEKWDVMSLLVGHSWDRPDGGVVAALGRWSQRWGPAAERPALDLVDDWFVCSGLYTLVAWLRHPLLRRVSRIMYVPGLLIGDARPARLEPYERTIAFDLSWFPVVESLQDAEERLLEECRRRIREDLRAVEADAERRGMVPSRVKRTGREHFEWLVRYQVRRESFAEIATEIGKTRQAVTEAVKETAALVDLTLRPAGQPGQPRKPWPPAHVVKVRRYTP